MHCLQKSFALVSLVGGMVLWASLFPGVALGQSEGVEPATRSAQDLLSQRLSYARGMLQQLAGNPGLTIRRDTFPEIRAALLSSSPSAPSSNSSTSSTSSPSQANPGSIALPAEVPVRGDSEGAPSSGKFQVRGTEALKPGKDTRFFRASSYSFSFLDQADNIFLEELDPDTGDPVFIENPDSLLWKIDYSVNPGKLFLSPSELKEIYESAAGASTKALIASADLREELEGKPDRLAFLAWADKSGKGKRFLASLSGSIGVAERPSLNGSETVPDFVRSRQDTDVTYSVTFDPKRLILFPDEAVDAYKALKAFTKLGGSSDLGDSDSSTCIGHDARECLKSLAGLGVHHRWIAGAIPKIEVMTVDEFDFVAVGGDFLRSNLLEDSIETVTLTWDLGSVLETAKHRRKALEAIALHDQLVQQDRMRQCTLEVRPETLTLQATEEELLYTRFSASYRGEPEACSGKAAKVQWKVDPGSDLSMLADGALVGSLPEGRYQVKVLAKDSFGHEESSTVTIRVEAGQVSQARQELVGRYAEISLLPEVVLDEAWFESFRHAWQVVLSEARSSDRALWSWNRRGPQEVLDARQGDLR